MSIYDDYGYGYGTTVTEGTSLFDILFGGMMVFFIISLIIVVFLAIVNYKIYKKAGRNGWEAFIPIYTLWVFMEIVGLPGWVSLIPGVNLFASLYAHYKLADKFGKSSAFGLGLLFFPYVFLPILAFGKNEYDKEAISANQNANGFYSQVENTNPISMPVTPQMENSNIGIQQSNLQRCSGCGATVQGDAKICFMCGKEL